ncbi:MAG: hypothetical protein KC561_01540 [Myxococcales bacterium]|nr:hypothetical protein [Myxococcales bacterium]
MATYKVDVISKLGKFHYALWEASGPKGDPNDSAAHDNLDDVVSSLRRDIDNAGFDDEDDSVIFRGIAYDDIGRLSREIKMGTY